MITALTNWILNQKINKYMEPTDYLRLIVWGIVLLLCVFLVRGLIKERENKKIEKNASLRVIKHVLKTLLQAVYMKQKGVDVDGKPLSIPWIVKYIKSKKNMPDKGTESYVANMMRTYDMMFDAIIDYIEATDPISQKNALYTIQKCIDIQHTDFNIFSIKTGPESEKDFRDSYSMLPNTALIPGKLYRVYSKNDIHADDLLEVVYIPRVEFCEYFTPSDFDDPKMS